MKIMKIMRKESFPAVLAFLAAILFLGSPGRTPAQENLNSLSDLELLRRADSLASYMDHDFSARYTMVQENPGKGRTVNEAAVFRRDRQDMYVIIMLKPAVSKGQGYLKKGDTLWFYDPESNRYQTTSSRERFQNTNARNSDFTRSTLAQDYRIEEGETVSLGRYQCRLLTLEAVTEEVTYPRMKIWISLEDGLVRKTEDYSLSGQHLRTTAIPSYQQVEGEWVPEKTLMVDELRGARVDGRFRKEKTQITITQPSLDSLDNSIFSKRFLENASR